MTLEAALALKLVEVAGSLVGSRVYPDALPQDEDESDCVLYSREDDDPLFYLDSGRDTTEVDTFTLSVWGTDRDRVTAVVGLLVVAFAGPNCQGTWGGVGGVFVWGATASRAGTDAQQTDEGSETLDLVERLTLKITWLRE